MKRSILTILVLLPFLAMSQKKQKDTAKVHMPIVNGVITYEKIIDSLNKPKNELFEASLKWLANTFEDSKEVIRVKNSETGEIVGSGNFLYKAPGLLGGNERMAFMIEIKTKDGKSRIRLYQLRYSILGSSGYKTSGSGDSEYFPFDKKYLEYLSEKQYPTFNKKLFLIIDQKINDIITSYELGVKSLTKRDDF